MFHNFELKKTDEGRIEGYLWDVEDPAGVVCIVHGIGEYGGRFDRVASELNRRSLAVVSMDLRGHGNSLGNKGHCAPRKDVLDDVTALGNPESVKPYSTNSMVHNRISLLCAVDGFETGQKLEKGTLEDDGGARGIPVLLMHGDEDRICDVEGSRIIAARLKAEGEDITYIEWPGLYHEIHNGGKASNGDEVIDTIAGWAEKFTGRTACE